MIKVEIGELHYQISDSDCTHVLVDPAFAEKVINAMAELTLKGTAAMIPSTRLQSLAADMQHLGNHLPSIRRLGVSGTVLSEAAYSAVQFAFAGLECVVNAYALTEAMGFICSPSVHAARGTDVGFPAPWAQIKVVDRHTWQRLCANQTGEICFRVPTMTTQYYKRPKDTSELFDEEGWCKSGDAGYYDEDGRLHIVQRLKEMPRTGHHEQSW